MQCENLSCHTEASVRLCQNLNKPTWLCPYCAAKTLRAVNSQSFKTVREHSMFDYSKKSDPPTKV